jgi:hypothetical protein
MSTDMRTYEAPACWAPSSPEMWCPTSEEGALVRDKRRLFASWQAIASMLNRPVLDVRRWYDPTFHVEPKVIAVDVASDSKPQNRGRVPTQASYRYGILACLTDGETKTYQEIISSTGRFPNRVLKLLSMMQLQGFIERPKRGSYTIAPAGLAEKADVDARVQSEGLKVTALQRSGRGGRG